MLIQPYLFFEGAAKKPSSSTAARSAPRWKCSCA